MRRTTASLLLVSALAVGTGLAGAAGAATAPAGPSWTPVADWQFDGTAGTFPAGWTADLGHSYPGGPPSWGTGEIQSYTADPANVGLDGQGHLAITAVNGPGGWTSARLETQRSDFAAPSGGTLKVEARIKLPAGGQGYWPAFWMLGTPYRGNFWNWPGIGEVDIMENIGSQPAIVHGTLHCGTMPGPCSETNGIGSSYPARGGTPYSAGYHTYATEWDASSSDQEVRWYVDGNLYQTVWQSDLPADVWAQMTGHGYFLLLNLAIGGGWPGLPDATTRSGASMLVDSVTVSTTPGAGDVGSAPLPPVAPSPTTAPSPSTAPSPTTSPSTLPSPTTSASPTGAPTGSPSAVPTGAAVAPVPGSVTREAERAAAFQSAPVVASGTANGGGYVGPLADRAWFELPAVDFGTSPLTQFYGRVASGAPGGVSGLLEVHLDTPTGPSVGSFALASTGGWQSWRVVAANITGTTGIHDVYVVARSGQPAAFVTVDTVGFGR